MKNLPWYIRWPLYIVLFVLSGYVYSFTKGFKLVGEVNSYVDERIEMKLAPMKEKHETQYNTINSKIDDQGDDIKEIRNFILYGKRPSDGP